MCSYMLTYVHNLYSVNAAWLAAGEVGAGLRDRNGREAFDCIPSNTHSGYFKPLSMQPIKKLSNFLRDEKINRKDILVDALVFSEFLDLLA